ncbi:hypothetical protein HIO71_03195 [Chryseobacterium aquaticum]|uniref:Uncharacterized protein n=1 Tax=Chryseobacterium aquaticum TaxID=452084 RepID=A0A848N3F5_9FLAO|nr:MULTISPECIES: hypothetical protein [Chryseobacterium]NMR33210.1 hypothetical protein [Chryseobacterium aquaticum]NRQ44858.1 hypothetical protein [Chryseobacterium sp. C-204]
MITRDEFTFIDKEIKDSLQKTLDDLKATSLHNYIIYLADGEYKPEYENSNVISNPFVIDNRIDHYKDLTRFDFLVNFLKNYYNFPSVQVQTDDNNYRISMELMIYCHVWESKPFLKKLFRLAHISNGEEYNWNIVVPDMSKHDFIRNDIRATLEAKGNNLAEIIKKGFHTSLRNAFAHSEYSIDTINGNRRIWLDTYTGKTWDIQEISFDDWSKRFVYTALLSYHLLNITHLNRINLISDLKTDKFIIKHPNKDGSISDREIQYRDQDDAFNFVI